MIKRRSFLRSLLAIPFGGLPRVFHASSIAPTTVGLPDKLFGHPVIVEDAFVPNFNSSLVVGFSRNPKSFSVANYIQISEFTNKFWEELPCPNPPPNP